MSESILCAALTDMLSRQAFKRGLSDGSCVLLRVQANQCDQNGGNTGMTPADFKKFVLEVADRNGLTVTESSLEEIT